MTKVAFKNRIVGQGTDSPDNLLANPFNWRIHSDYQKTVLEGALEQIGWIQQIIVNQRTGHIIDGHLRAKLAIDRGEPAVPVIYVDLTEDEEKLALATIDPIAALATTDPEKLDDILKAIEAQNEALAKFLDELASKDEARAIEQAELKASLADQFLVPPFTVLDGRQGYWQERKRAWLRLGIRSELGRGADGDKTKQGTLYAVSAQPPSVYDKKAEVERQEGRELSWKEFAEKYPEALVTLSDSIFDPVLAEIACRWFSAPGGRVLDPFAGGSVRGVVAAHTGRAYTGIDIRPEQVDANYRNWSEITGRAAAARLTVPPFRIETVDGIRVVRDDHVPGGSKVRALLRFLENVPERELVYASPAYGFAQIALGVVTKLTGRKATIFVAKRKTKHQRTQVAQSYGAKIIEVQAGYLSNVQAKAKAYAQEHAAFLVPFGVDCPEFVEALADVARETGENPPEVWCIAGSGVLSRALQKAFPDAKHYAVKIGKEPDAGNATLFEAPEKFDAPAELPPPFPSCAEYDAKAWRFVKAHASPGALFWNVAGEPAPYQPPAENEPHWIAGDSAKVLDTLPQDFDLLFSCPPYGDLEKYSDLEGDISAKNYQDFLISYREILKKAVDKLHNDRFAVWVVGELRDPKGHYRNFIADTIAAFQDAGMKFYNEAIYLQPIGSLPMRAGAQFRNSRKLGKAHQNLLVFAKGDPEKLNLDGIAEAIKTEFGDYRELIEAHAKVLVFAKGDPKQATAAAGPVAIDEPLE